MFRVPFTISFFFAWYDLWIGFYICRPARAVFFCPLPCIVICFQWKVQRMTTGEQLITKELALPFPKLWIPNDVLKKESARIEALLDKFQDILIQDMFEENKGR